MPLTLEVRQLKFSTGERFSLLVDKGTGIPDFDVSVYVLTQLRSRNLSAATIKAATRSIMFGLQIFSLMGIEFKQRIAEGVLFGTSELDDMLRRFYWSQKKVNAELVRKAEPNVHRNLIKLESVRVSCGSEDDHELVDPNSAYIRIIYFRDFIEWLVQGHLRALPPSALLYLRLSGELKATMLAINRRLPRAGVRRELEPRQGLLVETEKHLLKMTDPEASINPWNGSAARHRNYLMILMLLRLGLRKGEMLGLRVSDVDFIQNNVTIHRRADDKDDPRLNQPNAKTNARRLPLDSGLAQRLHAYITGYRRSTTNAKKHPFLFVSIGAGAPLSISALDKIFIDIKKIDPATFLNLSPHILRHTWNDRFSELMDERKIDETKEEAARSYLMGWNPGSGTAATYVRRHIRNSANKASLAMQEKFSKLK